MSLIAQVEGLEVHDPSLVGYSETVSSVEGGLPAWAIWVSTIVLSLTIAIGLPLNGATVLIFLCRKKLRHLVNFVLLLDCLSHIILCVVCIPVHLIFVWSQPTDIFESTASLSSSSVKWATLLTLQQVVGNFANLYGVFLSFSIAVLRYRRLCWKKKDKFSRLNAVKWGLPTGTVALVITCTESWTSIHPEMMTDLERTTLTLHAVKVTLILSAAALVFFCYVRVSQRVWANAASQEKVMDPMKLKKSRSVHLRATIHSCVQIILVVAMTAPYLYEETIRIMGFINSATPNAISAATTTFIPVMTTSATNPQSISGGAEGSESEAMPLVESPNHQHRYNHLTRLMALTLNYTLLALGTPIAYIASCHRFREQFTAMICRRMYFLSMTAPHGHQGQVPGGHHNNNNTNNNFASNQRKLKSPSSPSPTGEIFDTVSLPRTRSQRSRSRSQPMALSPSTMISSAMSTPAKGAFCYDGRRASCQSVRVHMNRTHYSRTNQFFFPYCSPNCDGPRVSTVHNGINHFISNTNYSSYGSSSSSSEMVGHNV